MGEEALILCAGLSVKTLDVFGFSLVGRCASIALPHLALGGGERMVEPPFPYVANIFDFFQPGILRRKACQPPLLAEDQEALMSCSPTQLVMTLLMR